MSGDGQRPKGTNAPDAATYERRLRGAMRFMSRAHRDAVAREIMGDIQAKVAARGGDFGAVADDLDDPRWVGAQMVLVYGVWAPWKALLVVAAALLAWVSVPGALLSPATDPTTISVSLLSFGALIVTLFGLILRQLTSIALWAAAAAAATRAALLAFPQEGVALAGQLSTGELSLYLMATLLLLVVGGVPALALRLRGGSA